MNQSVEQTSEGAEPAERSRGRQWLRLVLVIVVVLALLVLARLMPMGAMVDRVEAEIGRAHV